jgi:preprotein translocase subunit SecD
MRVIKILVMIMMTALLLCSCSHVDDSLSTDSPVGQETGTVLQDGTVLYEQGSLSENAVVELKDENENVLLENRHIMKVFAKYSDMNDYFIELELTEEGSNLFEIATTDHIGKVIDIVVDGKVVSSPMVQDTITNCYVVVSSFENYDKLMQLFKTLTK